MTYTWTSLPSWVKVSNSTDTLTGLVQSKAEVINVKYKLDGIIDGSVSIEVYYCMNNCLLCKVKGRCDLCDNGHTYSQGVCKSGASTTKPT